MPRVATQDRDPPGTLGPTGEGPYVVAAGNGISSIAAATGHFWETLRNDPANAALKAARADPEMLYPGAWLSGSRSLSP